MNYSDVMNESMLMRKIEIGSYACSQEDFVIMVIMSILPRLLVLCMLQWVV